MSRVSFFDAASTLLLDYKMLWFFPRKASHETDLSLQNASLMFHVSTLEYFLFHYKMANMGFHNNMTYTGSILQYFFIGFPILWIA